jgi:hypothetical protein
MGHRSSPHWARCDRLTGLELGEGSPHAGIARKCRVDDRPGHTAKCGDMFSQRRREGKTG